LVLSPETKKIVYFRAVDREVATVAENVELLCFVYLFDKTRGLRRRCTIDSHRLRPDVWHKIYAALVCGGCKEGGRS